LSLHYTEINNNNNIIIIVIIIIVIIVIIRLLNSYQNATKCRGMQQVNVHGN